MEAREIGSGGGGPAAAIQARFHRALRGIVCTSDSEWGDALVARHRTHPAVKFRSSTAQPGLLLEAVRQENVDLVLVDHDLAGTESGLAVAERVARAFPRVHVYLTSASPTMALHHEAMVRGIRSVIAKPFEPEELVAVVASALAQEQEAAARLEAAGRGQAGHQAPAPAQAPRLVAVAGGKGGTGKSNVATNLAVLAQTNPSARLAAAVVDLERNEGTLPYLLGGMRKQPTVADWAAYVQPEQATVDPGLVQRALVAEHEQSGLHAVFGADRVRDYDSLDGQTVAVMLNTLRLMHALTVVDCPPTLTAPAMVALEQATSIVIVTELDLAALAATKRYLQELEAEEIDVGKARILYNRVRPRSPTSVEEAADVLADYGAYLVPLPEDEAVPLARSKLRPAALEYPDCPWVRALRKVAAEILPGLGLEIGAAAASSGSRPAAGRRRFLGLF